jgi:hypothetical protein
VHHLGNKVLDIVDAWCNHEIYVLMVLFLGVFAKLQKVTSSFVLSVRPFIYMEQLGSLWMDFHET